MNWSQRSGYRPYIGMAPAAGTSRARVRAPLVCAAALLAATASAAAVPDCPGHLAAWAPECWVAENARISFGGDRCGAQPRAAARGAAPPAALVCPPCNPRDTHAPIPGMHPHRLPPPCVPCRPHKCPPAPMRALPPPCMFRRRSTVYWTPFTSDKWGNALSGYWQARALALLAGYGFDAYGAPRPSPPPSPPHPPPTHTHTTHHTPQGAARCAGPMRCRTASLRAASQLPPFRAPA